MRDKMRADFNADPDTAFTQVNDALQRISNRQQGRVESPDFHTDWSFDWKKNDACRWMIEWTFVDHGAAIEYCILTRCAVFFNDQANAIYEAISEEKRQEYARKVFARIVDEANDKKMKIRLADALEKFQRIRFLDVAKQVWTVEISSRRMGIDNGKDTLVHVDQLFERALQQMNREERAKSDSKVKEDKKGPWG